MRDYIEKIRELGDVRVQIKVLAEHISNEDDYRIVRNYLEELIKLSEREKELTAYVKEIFMAEIDERERKFLEERQ